MVPEVKKCTVDQCFYWRDNCCYANAILVGSDEPVCETFTPTGNHTDKHGQGEVGACHIDNCEYNQGKFCHACNDIEVVFSNTQAWCNTYEARM